MGQSVEEQKVALPDTVHPDAPSAASGSGSGRAPNPIFKSDVPLLDSPQTHVADPIPLADKKNPPPATQPGTKDVNGVQVTIKADNRESSGSGAFTDAPWAPVGQVQWQPAGNKIKITSAPKAGLTIQTTYYGTSQPTDQSAYGRGTKPSDVTNGDVTLGFHESCHRQDYIDYCTNNKVPVYESSKVTTPTEAQAELTRWSEAVNQFFRAMRAKSDKDTDEVGNPTKSDYKKKHP